MTTHKTCNICNKTKNLSYFYDDNSKKDSKHGACKPCFTSRGLMLKYGITLDEYHILLDQQGGGCLVCGDKPKKHRLHVDHDHDTGKIRGLLCQACNVSIGKMKDSPTLIRKLADYLEDSRTEK